MPKTKKPRICTLNQHLLCKLCGGYFVDATTIIECLHTFCRSCIVKLLESTKYCPVCDVQVHKSKPLLSLRSDKIIQDLVYKLVPRLFNDELQRRRDFANLHPQERHDADAFAASFRRPASHVCVTLRQDGGVATSSNPRYLRCPAGVAVSHIQRLIAAKYDLKTTRDRRALVDVMHRGERLDADFTLTDVFYVYKLSATEPINLTYRIYEYVTRQLKLEQKQLERVVKEQEAPQTTCGITATTTTTTNNNWKEVQLRISENGEMSIETTSQNNNNGVVHVVDVNKTTTTTTSNSTLTTAKKKEFPELKLIKHSTTEISILSDVVVVVSTTTTSQQAREICNVVTSVTTPCVATLTTCQNLKRKNDENNEDSKKLTTTTKVGICSSNNNNNNNNNDNNNKKHKAEGETATTTLKCNNNNNTNFTSPKPSTKYQPCYVPKITKNNTTTTSSGIVTTTATTKQPQQQQKLGYKTLRDPPKSWYKQIADATVVATAKQPPDGAGTTATPTCGGVAAKSTHAISDTKSGGERPANKFFKMRNNNMLRFLGNPASGVKPMYSVQHHNNSQQKEEKKEKSVVEIKKHSIVKIDPKTLKPISEKAPENTSLTTSTSKNSNTDLLKINTSQVSIFNPLKLQQHSPKTATPPLPPPSSSSAPSTSPQTIPKRDKPNLNFTPPNPFVPNLSSQTAPPTQFLTTPPPPSSGSMGNSNPFPSYDPRVMAAAYHNLFYHHAHQRMASMGVPYATPPTSSSTSCNSGGGSSNAPHFGVGSGFDIAKIVEGMQLKQQQMKKIGGVIKGEESIFNNVKPRLQIKTKDKDKSLQNTVEKLTLSRAKEIQKTEEILKKKEAEKSQEEASKKTEKSEEKQEDGECSKKGVVS